MSIKYYDLITLAIFTFLFLDMKCQGQRPITDSIITKMHVEMYNGHKDEALKLAKSGYKYAIMEEPKRKDFWKLFFTCRRAQVLIAFRHYEEAEELLNKLKLDQLELNGRGESWRIRVINVKGSLYQLLLDYEKAELEFLRGLKHKHANKWSQIDSYSKLSQLMLKINKLNKALHYVDKELQLRKLNGDTTRPSYVNSLAFKSTIQARLGKQNEALNTYKKVEALFPRINYAKNDNHLIHNYGSVVYLFSEDYQKALIYAKKAQESYKEAHGDLKSHYKLSSLIGECYFRLNNKDSAYHYFKTIPEKLIVRNKESANFGSIRGMELLLNQDNIERNKLFSMLSFFDNEFPDFNKEVYNNILFSKNYSTNQQERLNVYYRNRPNHPLKSKFDKWQRSRETYFNWLTSNSPMTDTSIEMSNELEIQEKELNKVADLEIKYSSFNGLLKSLNKTSVAIEFLRYKDLKTEENIYGALVVSPEHDYPIFVKLCKESDLKSLLKYKFAETDYEYSGRVYKSNTIYNLIWKPLEKYLLNKEDCYVSLSGLLYKIALDATFAKDAPIHPNIHLLQSTAAMMEDAPNMPKSPKALLYGGITYNLNKVETIDSLSMDISESVHSYHRGVRGENWDYLKGTEKEVKKINTLLKRRGYQVELNLGKSCSENAFKTELKDSSPNIIHIATHGYYPVNQDSVLSYTQTASYARSGLVMAGANTSKTSKAPISGFGDGILTSPEITALNLSNTQLVVLSACESGKGKISHVDEVYGLQRAFKITGAHYVIYTLWKIPDEPTKDFMVYFYKTLSEGNTIKESFFLTKEYMKKTQPIYHWAGFQLIE